MCPVADPSLADLIILPLLGSDAIVSCTGRILTEEAYAFNTFGLLVTCFPATVTLSDLIRISSGFLESCAAACALL